MKALETRPPIALPTALPDRFGVYLHSVDMLRVQFPRIFGSLYPERRLEDVEGWSAMLKRQEALRRQGGRPVLVATLYGPSGAGKSTLFRLLTGVDVPAGNDVRPVSYASAVAVPQTLVQNGVVDSLFPGFRLEPLESTQQLRDKKNQGKLFPVAYSDAERQELPLVLADVPDFTTVEVGNWEQCRRMLERAEIVLFAVFSESYVNRDVIEELARCCQLAGRMAYLLTKTQSAEQARRIWDDLVLRKLTSEEQGLAAKFAQRRADGRTLLEFLAQAPVYHSPWREQPHIEDIQPLRPEDPPLESLLRGATGEDILLSGLLEPARWAVKGCRDVLAQVDDRIRELEDHLRKAEVPIAQAAERIAGSEFPIGRMMELVLEETRKHQGWMMRGLTAPFRWFNRGMSWMVKSGKEFIARLVGQPITEQVLDRSEHEREQLAREMEQLFTYWRSQFPEEAREDKLLAQARWQEHRAAVKQLEPPPPTTGWEDHVRTAVNDWATQHPVRADFLPSVLEVMKTAGIGLVVADLVLTGGIVGTIGLLGAAGGGSFAASSLLDWAEKKKLKQVFLDADEAWRSERAATLRHFLGERLLTPIFAPWTRLRDELRRAPVQPCLEACGRLDALGTGLRKE